jgi:Methane oxygenase PmoA
MAKESPLGWSTVKLPQGVMVISALGNPVAGIGHNFFRPWLYPLYSPSGRQVLQEYPFDHPFHNGLFIGWHPIKHGGRENNFWATPPQRSDPDPMMNNLGQVRAIESSVIQSSETCIQLTQLLDWVDIDGKKLFNETRTFTLWQPGMLSHAVRMESTLTCLTADPIIFEHTKFAGIGVRLDPALTPALGGHFENSSGEVGRASLFHGNYFESLSVRSRNDDLELKINPNGFTAPWFVRDYGLVLLNPSSPSGQALGLGQCISQSVELIASDI